MMDSIVMEVGVLVEALRALGPIGAAMYALIFLVATLALIPASPLAAIAGFLYGPVLGTLLISPAGMASAALAFLVGRTLSRRWRWGRLDRWPQLTAMDHAMAREGFRFVLLLRLASIVPFAPLSYGLSASRIATRDFILGSWLGLLPGTFLYVYLGSLVSDIGQILRDDIPPSPFTQVMTWGGLTIALAVLWKTARFAKQAIQQSIDSEQSA